MITDNISKSLSKNKIEVLLFVLTIAVFLAFGAMKFPILKDYGLFSFIAQNMINGNPLYSIPDISGPFLYMAHAICMMAFSFLPNWMAIRVGMLIVAGLTTALFYRLTARMLSKTTALFSSIVLISFAFFAEYFVLGDSKCIVLFLLMLGFNLLFSGKNLMAGACFMLCPLTWQPSAIFMAGPLTYYFLEGLDRKKLMSFASGAVLAASTIIGYFIITNTLSDFIEFALILPMQYKSAVYLKYTLEALFNIIACYNVEMLFIAAAVLGFVYYAWKHGKTLAKRRMQYLKEHKLAASFIIPFMLFTLYISADMQVANDFIFHLAIVSLICGLLLTKITSILSDKINRSGSTIPYKKHLAFIIMIVLVAAYGFFPAMQPVSPENHIITYLRSMPGTPTSQIPSLVISKYGLAGFVTDFLTIRTGEQNTIDDQLALAKYINDNSGSDDKILSVSGVEIMFLANRTSINRYPLLMSEIFLWHLKESGEMQQIMDDIITTRPKFILFEDPAVLKTIGIEEFVYQNYNKNENITIMNLYETDLTVTP